MLENGDGKVNMKQWQESEDIGFSKGRATGIAEERIKTAVGLKKANVDIDIIVSCTGLPKEKVLAL